MSRTLHRVAPLAVVAALSVGSLAACGSGSTTTSATTATSGAAAAPTTAAPTTTGAPLTKADFVEKANAACRIPNAESDKIGEELKAKHPDPKAVPEAEYQALMRDAVDRLKPLWEQSLDELRALQPPAEDKAMVEAGITHLEAFIKTVDADPGAIGNPNSSRVYPEGYDYGLTDCFEKPKTTFSSIGTAIS